ncbi:MAG: SRPBCC family protein [Verrucomicrobiota bacterium]
MSPASSNPIIGALSPLLLLSIALLTPAGAEETEGNSPDDWITDSSQWAQLKKGEVVLLDSHLEADLIAKGSTLHSATAAILVDASPTAVRSVIDDGDRAADFQNSLKSSRVVERTPEYTLLDQTVKIGFHSVSYIVRQIPTSPALIEFTQESGDLERMNGFWRFLDLSESGKEQTLLVYRLSLEPKVKVPPFLLRKSIERNLPETLRSVRVEVAKRAQEP